MRKVLWTGLGLLVVMISLLVAVKSVMKTVPTGPLGNGVYAVNDGFVDMFVVREGRETICIDSGLTSGGIRKGFRRIGIDPDSVAAVFFTHSDRDHAGGAELFKNADFYLPGPEVQMVNGKTKRVIFGRERTNRISVVYKALKEGKNLRFGDIVVLPIWTPGHTPGSTSYLIDGKWLFTGDLLMLKKGRAVPNWKGLDMDAARSIESMKMLRRDLIGVDLLLTSHSGISRDFDKAMEEYK